MSWHTSGSYSSPGEYRDLVMAFKSVIFVLSLYKRGVTDELIKDSLAAINAQLHAARGLNPKGKEKRAKVWAAMLEVERGLLIKDAQESIQELVHLLESW